MPQDPFAQYAHISQIVGTIASILGLIAAASGTFLMLRFKAWFYKWLVTYNNDLEEKYITRHEYDKDHRPNSGNSQYRHARG